MNRKLSNLFKKFRYVRKKREDDKQISVGDDEENCHGSNSPTNTFPIQSRFQQQETNHHSSSDNDNSSEEGDNGDKEEEEENDKDELILEDVDPEKPFNRTNKPTINDTRLDEIEQGMLIQKMRELDLSSQPKKNRNRESLFRGYCVNEEFAVVIQVISRVHMDFKFCNETLFYSIDLAKRYFDLTSKVVTPSDFVVVLFTSLFIASKFEEVDHLFIDELLQLAKKYRYFAEVFKPQKVREIRMKFRYSNIQDLEVKIISKLRFKPVNRAISLWFAREYFINVGQVESFECNVCQFVLESLFFNFSSALKYTNMEKAICALNVVKRLKYGKNVVISQNSSNFQNHLQLLKNQLSQKKFNNILLPLITQNNNCEIMLIKTLKTVIENQYNRHRIRKVYTKENDFVIKNFNNLLEFLDTQTQTISTSKKKKIDSSSSSSYASSTSSGPQKSSSKIKKKKSSSSSSSSSKNNKNNKNKKVRRKNSFTNGYNKLNKKLSKKNIKKSKK